MKISVEGIAKIQHAETGETFLLSSDELDWNAVASDERQMGTETQYQATIEHPELGLLSWNLWEYPVGAENFSQTETGSHTVIEDFEYHLHHVLSEDASHGAMREDDISDTACQHLAWLLEGRGAWNARRARDVFTPDLAGVNIRSEFEAAGKLDKLGRFDLEGLNLQDANLRGANLRGANLRAANLRAAGLRGANLEEADLQGANFRTADLREAGLRDVNLEGAILRAADLRMAILQPANLQGASFEGADLRRANLEGAILGGADLKGANLEGARLLGANLEGADLQGVNLVEADLRGCDLLGSNFIRADLRGADLRGANFQRANLVWANLDEANVQSVLNTKIGGQTEYTDISHSALLTQAQLFNMFGDSGTIIPDNLTRPTHWPVLEEPTALEPPPPEPPHIQASDRVPAEPFIFLSYASRDYDRIAPLYDFLSDQSLPVWWDQDIPAGATWRDEIAKRLDTAAAVLTLWTLDSTQSSAVNEEAASAQSKGKLVHARLDDAVLPYGFAETQYVDLRGWDGSPDHPAMRKLVQALRDKINPPTSAEMNQRLQQASPVAMAPHNGKLSPVDTPPHAPPETVNVPDLDARLDGLRQSLASLQGKAREGYQLPQALFHCLDAIAAALKADPLTWYALEDSRDSLADCLEVHDAPNTWNDVIVRDLMRIVRRIGEVRPLLQPRQIPPDQPGAKPSEPDPVIRTLQAVEVVDIANQIGDELATPESDETLDDNAKDALQTKIDQITEAATLPDEDRKLFRLRVGLRGLAYLTGGIITTVGSGVAVSLLTAPGAAVTFAQRLQPIYEMILKFFL